MTFNLLHKPFCSNRLLRFLILVADFLPDNRPRGSGGLLLYHQDSLWDWTEGHEVDLIVQFSKYSPLCLQAEVTAGY